MPYPKLLIFDFDGTLADTCHLGFALMVEAGQKYGFAAPKTYLEYQELMVLSVPQVLWKLQLSPWRLKEIIAENMKRGSMLLTKCSLFPGIEELVRNLSEKSELAIVTSNLEAVVENYLHTFGLQKYFSQILGAETDFKKPEKIRRCLVSAKVKAENALFIGDSVRDLKDAARVGVATLAVTYGIHDRARLATGNPDYWADSATEIQAVVEMLQSSL